MNRRYIYVTCAFVGVLTIAICVWRFCYKPNFSTALSVESADWGNFGQFFFGLGTLMVAIVTAYIMLGIDTQLHRSNIIKLYEKTLRRFRNSINKDLMTINPNEMSSAYMDMYGVLIIIQFDDNFSFSVNKRAEKLFNTTLSHREVVYSLSSYLKEMKNQSEPDEHHVELYFQLVELISNLTAFLICLSNNEGKYYKDILEKLK